MTRRQPPSRFGLLLVAALSLLGLGGCTFLKQLVAGAFQKPTLRFSHANVTELSLGGATLDLVYLLENRNAVGITLAEIDYALFVEGKQVLSGHPPAGLTIKPQGASELHFPASVKFLDLAQTLETFLTKDVAKYRAQGQVGIQTPIGILRFPIAHEDQFEVPKVPAVAVGAPRITQLTFQRATLEVPLTLTNRNSFDLPLSGLTANVRIAGANVGALSAGGMSSIPARQSVSTTASLSFDLLSATAAASALRQGSAAFDMVGRVESAGTSVPFSLNQAVTFRR